MLCAVDVGHLDVLPWVVAPVLELLPGLPAAEAGAGVRHRGGRDGVCRHAGAPAAAAGAAAAGRGGRRATSLPAAPARAQPARPGGGGGARCSGGQPASRQWRHGAGAGGGRRRGRGRGARRAVAVPPTRSAGLTRTLGCGPVACSPGPWCCLVFSSDAFRGPVSALISRTTATPLMRLTQTRRDTQLPSRCGGAKRCPRAA